MENRFDDDREELVEVNYNYGLAEAGEEKVVRVLQGNLQRQSHTNSLNKQLFQDRSDYFTETEVKSKASKDKSSVLHLEIDCKIIGIE